MQLKILTFNWHEPYIGHLARLGHSFTVVAPDIGPGRTRDWDARMRPLPDNCRLMSQAEALSGLRAGSFDLAIAHNVKDLIWLREFDLPKICVFHCRLTTEIALSRQPIDRADYLAKVNSLLQGVQAVYISKSKQADWGLPGQVIDHGVDTDEFKDYSGDRAEVLRVGNLLKEMDLARGFTLGEKIIDGFPCITLGLNPGLPGARLSEGFDDLREHYRHCRVYLNTTPPLYEDGHNLSLLEAMATGMPVVATAHPESPIADGVNGYISDDPQILRQRVEELLNHSDQARQLGTQARETVKQQFPMSRFLHSWQKLIHTYLNEYLKTRGYDEKRQATPFDQLKRKNILMDYVAHPATTAHYLDRALRGAHNVITCGAALNQEVIDKWDLHALRWPVQPQDIFRGTFDGIVPVLEQLPQNWQPDFYLYVETGLSGIPADLAKLSIPKVCYLIDTHLHLQNHLEMARQFDVVFLAQKEYLPQFQEQGMRQVHWLPLACDPEIHGKVEVPKRWDVGFVGSITPLNPRRQALLEIIGRNFDLHVDRKFMDEMTQVFCESRIIFNNAIKHDLNMRVFEALCTGSLLVTDAAVGLEELFEDRRHLVLYRDENLIETLHHYLGNPEERERIAAAGQAEVLAHHTYSHRAEHLIETLSRAVAKPGFSLPIADEDQPVNQETPANTAGSYYHHVRRDLIPLVPAHVKAILEIGCGAGNTGAFLKETRGAFVAGVELNPEAAAQARQQLDDVVEGNLETMELPYTPATFDCILCADVLEHLSDPLAVLKKLKTCLKPGGVVVASIPNVQFFGVVNHLAEGNWTYEDEGILDRTHLRFFTWKEIEKLFLEAGLKITAMDETLDPQYEAYQRSGQTTLKVGRVTISGLSPEEMRRFFVFQYKLAATPVETPVANENFAIESGDEVLTRARQLEKQGHYEEALNLYRTGARDTESETAAWIGQGNCQLRLGQLAKADACYDHAVQQDPRCVEAWIGKGLMGLQASELDTARRYFEHALGFAPQNDRAWCGLAVAHERLDHAETALEYYLNALQYNRENSTALTSLLQLAYAQERFEEAEKALRDYLDLHPANLNMLFGLAGILFRQGRMDEARELLDKILMFAPDHADARHLMEQMPPVKVSP